MDPVIIVGAGPAGLALSLALARHEVPTLLLDQSTGEDEERFARTVVLREDTAALAARLAGTGFTQSGTRLTGVRSLRRRQEVAAHTFDEALPAPLHLPQHTLTRALRDALDRQPLARLIRGTRLDRLEQDSGGVTAHTSPAGTGGAAAASGGSTWRGSHLIGCDGPRSTVRKLLDIRFPGRTAVERHAVAAVRCTLPFAGEAILHRTPPWRGSGNEVTARPLPGERWRIDWLLPPGDELVTPEALVARVRATLAGWTDGTTPPYDLLDTGVYTVHHRLARRWRSGRVLLAGDAAHLLGALGTPAVDEGLRDIDNLAWKLALVRHGHAAKELLDSYQEERRAVVASRLRAADQSLPILRGGSPLRPLLPGSARGHEALHSDGHLGRGPLGAPPAHLHSPLTPTPPHPRTSADTGVGDLVTDVPVTAEDGSTVRLRDRLGRTALLVVLVAPGTGVWDRRHWMTAGVMPRLAEAVAGLPQPAELLVAETYPGAAAHTVLLVRPDGHLALALSGVDESQLRAAARTVCGADAGTREEAARAAR
ncbi:monooxygenase [Streptomyces albidoflavus]|uniref:FAD-dependent monooxygenase n=1 Tax=Streptomyces albidoflavus TaxID=1886 RepID=UPI00101E6DAB|nr:FAD-dependent monooxygenase [Streptomyces albidoflavus]RZE06403.1 monooxygenase [Streptomyces albidoflavus]RZE07722.1 monooxygenase [Streptomyces albidoflavus]RZE14197.1 monooxygenase [Streptomyces albidoflavus]